MESFFNNWSPWNVAHIAAHLYCAIILIIVVADATMVGLLFAALRLVFAPFVLGVVVVEILSWRSSPDALLLWLCVTITYYVSIRLNHETSVDPLAPWALTKSFAMSWTVYAMSMGVVFVLIALRHPNYRPIRMPGLELIVQRTVEWFVDVSDKRPNPTWGTFSTCPFSSDSSTLETCSTAKVPVVTNERVCSTIAAMT